MPLIDLRMTNDEFSALSLGAHLQEMTLNDYISGILTDQAKETIELFEEVRDAETAEKGQEHE